MRETLFGILILVVGVAILVPVLFLAALLFAFLLGFAAGEAGFLFRRARAWLRVRLSPTDRALNREADRGARAMAAARWTEPWR